MVADKNLMAGLEELRERVESVNRVMPAIALRGGTYRAPSSIQTLTWCGWVFGYKIEDHSGIFMRKTIYIKADGYKIDEIPEEQREPIMLAVYEVLLEQGSDMPKIEQIAPDALMIEQDFIPCLLTELNPNIVTPGRRG